MPAVRHAGGEEHGDFTCEVGAGRYPQLTAVQKPLARDRMLSETGQNIAAVDFLFPWHISWRHHLAGF